VFVHDSDMMKSTAVERVNRSDPVKFAVTLEFFPEFASFSCNDSFDGKFR
jgi:hypothetical protein